MNCTSYFKCSDKSVLPMERLNAFTLLKSVDNGKLFQTFITLHAKKRLLAELVLLGLYNLYMWPRVTVHGHNLKKSSHAKSFARKLDPSRSVFHDHSLARFTVLRISLTVTSRVHFRCET